MGLAYILYTFLPILLAFLAYKAYRFAYKDRKVIFWIIIILYALVIGLRYNVGTDYMTYVSIYEGNDVKDKVEIGFQTINNVLTALNMPYPIAFIVYAFLQFFFFIFAIKDERRSVVMWCILLYFFTTYIFLANNVIRQCIAFSLFIFSTKYILNKKFFKYFICITIALSIHSSAIILYPFYFFINHEWIKNKKVSVIILLLCFLSGPFIQKYFWIILPFFAKIFLNLDVSSIMFDLYKDVNWSAGMGLGNLLWLIVGVLVIINYNTLKTFFNQRFILYFNLYYLGLLISFIVGTSYLSRINIYFENFRIIIIAMLFYVFYRSKSYKKIKFGVLCVLILILIFFYYLAINRGASLCAPFQFI